MSTLNRTFSVKSGIDVANTVLIDSNRNLVNVGNVTPTGNLTQSLGSPTARFKDLYVGGSTVYIGDTVLSATGDEIRSNTFNASISFVSGGINVLDQANTARTTANDAYGQANTARDTANGAYGQANTARDTANNAYDRANGAYETANNKVENINAAGAIDISSGETNNVISYTINVNRASISTVGVTKLIDSVSSSDTANAATANAVKSAYDFANTMLPKSGGTISGDLTVSGNLYLSENTTLINVTSIQVDDPLIYLASNNDISDTVDIGFMGGKNTSGTYSHTGLIRHAADQKYYLFDGLPDESHVNNVINVASTYLATLKANIEANSILLVGETVATQANLTLAHNQANTARTTANDAYAQANTARGTANDAYDQANTGYSQANSAYGKANAAYGQANAAYGGANTANTNALNAYAQANTATTNAGNAYDQANSAYGQANAAYDRANTKVSKSGDTMTGGLTITTSGIGLSVANANVTYSLQVGTLNVTTNTVTTAASGQVVLDKFPATQLASAKYFVQANSSSDYHTTEIVLVQDATNVWISEYGSIQTGPSLGTFSADISSGDVRLLFTAVNSVNTIRSVRYGIVP